MNTKRKLRKGRSNGFFKHKGRRILAFALALVLIVGVVPDMAIVVKAGEPYQFDPVVDSVTFYDDGSVKSITASTNWQWTGSENYWVALLLGEGIATQHSGYTYAQWYRRQNRYHTLEDSLSAASVTNIANTDFIGPVANTSSHGVSRTLTLPKGTIKPGENKEYYLYIWTHDDHTSSGEGIGYYPDCVVANVQTTIDSIYIKRRDNDAELFSWTGNSVTLDKQNGAGGSDSVVVKNGSAMPTISVPTRSGYVFGGYYESTSNGSQYYTASGTSARNWDKSSDSTLYARWVYIPVITGPSNVSMTYGESGKTVSVSVPAQTSHSYTYQWYVNSANNNTGGTAVSGATSASYTIPTGKTAGTTEYYYCVVTATRSDSSQTATAVSDVATVTVNKVLAMIGTAPVKVDNLIYTGSAQELVTAGGDVTGGTLQYALGTDSTTAPTSDWGTDIPTKTVVGTYYVWYKVAGDENHTDTDPVCITVDIDTKTDVTAEQKQGETLTYDGTAKTPTLEIKDGETEIDTYTVKYVGVEPTIYEESETAPTDAGNYKAVITLKGNYSGTKEVPFKIDKKAAAVLTDNQKPTKNNALEYTSNPIELVTAPAGTIPAGYTIEYSIDNGTTWTTAIPTATVAGDYTVKVRYKGDENHEDLTGDDINVNIAKAVPNFTVPEDINASYGQKLSDVSLPTGWSWKDGTTSVGEIGTKTFKATFTPYDTTNYKTIEMDVAVKVNKAVPIIETKPKKVDNLIYTGLPCELVTAGSGVTGGTLKYVLGADSDATPTDEAAWSTEIPTATDARTYYVWYKVVGDENHNDTNPVCIKVTIAEKKDTDTSIKTEVEADKDAPAIKVDNFDETLAEKLLTDEEKESYEAGTPVLVYLDEKVVDKNDVPAEDMTAIEKTIADEGYTYGVCLDLSLWKKLGNNAAVQIHDTNGNPIKITITIPDTLKNAPEGYIRTYQIVRVHDGVATVLAEGTGDTLAISSDKFSSYFIVYKDAKKAADDKKQDTPATVDMPKQDTPATVDTPKAEVTNTDNANKDNKISTGDKMHIGIIIMLMIDSAMAAFYLTLRKKKIK